MGFEPVRAEALFTAAAAMATREQRDAYLDDACRNEPRLRERVEALLRAHLAPGTFLEPPARVDSPAAGPTEAVGDVVGPYRLLEKVGEGGFGTVFMAEQEHPVRRTVALKILKPGVDSPQVIARFEAERHALALMDHPNIARVLDAGTTDSGRPYFVMELVRGVPLTQYCDERRLTPWQRLGLFVQVCNAVQHAHQKGAIHRDLKPSNVLVALYDGKPVPKVIDFGVAKATGAAFGGEGAFTGFGQMVGTLEYMSPEQAGLKPVDVDTRSDVYSLGVLLYELLTGTTPLEAKRLKEGAPLEALRLIREEEPPKPSTRLAAIAELPSVAASRGVEPVQLISRVRGELDWIVMRCLEKDRDRRYETANALALDLERHMGDEPVLARPAGRGYRLRKFVRRNRIPVVAAAAVVAALLVGVVGTSWGMYRATRARGAAVAEALERGRAEAAANLERDKALDAEADTAAFSNFLTNYVLAAARPKGVQDGLGVDVTVADAVAAAEGKIDAVFAGRPKAEAAARHAIGVTWKNLERYPEAEANLRRAASLREEHLGPEAGETIDTLNSLAVVLQSTGDLDGAEPLFRKLLDVQRKAAGTDNADTAHLLNNLAIVRELKGEVDDAETLFRRALEIDLKVVGEESPDVAEITANLARVLQRKGDLANAQSACERALEIRQKVLSPGHPSTLKSLHQLATIYSSQGRLDEAEPLFKEALAGLRTTLMSNHGETLAVLNDLGLLYQKQGRLAEAEPLAREVLDIWQKRAGENHVGTATALNNMALICARNGRFDEAESFYRKSLASFRATRGDVHPDTIHVMNNLADLNKGRGRMEDDAVFRQVLERLIPAVSARLDAGGSDDPAFRARLLVYRGNTNGRLGRLREAAADYSAAIRLDPTDHYRWIEGGSAIAYVGDKEAFAAHGRALLERFGDTEDRAFAERTARLLGSVPTEFSGVDPGRLVELADRAVAGGAPHQYLDWFELAKGMADYRVGRFESAVQRVRKGREPAGDLRRVVLCDLYEAMARHRLGEREEAAELLRRTTDTMDRSCPKVGEGDLGGTFQDFIYGFLARREAEALINGASGPLPRSTAAPDSLTATTQSDTQGNPPRAPESGMRASQAAGPDGTVRPAGGP